MTLIFLRMVCAAKSLRPLLAASLLTLCAALGAGCAGFGGVHERVAAPSCDSIAEIQSYRYTINLKLDSPAFEAAASTATPAPPVSAFADALEALFSDLKLDGAFLAPDRTQAVLRFKGGELELREVGGRSWMRVQGVWQELTASDEDTILTPEVVCRDIVDEIAPTLDDVEPERATVSNIETDLYQLDKADITRLPELLGAGTELDVPEKFQVDLWLAREGRFPVRLNIGAEDTDEQGHPIGLSLFMEFRDLNDPGISIEPPAVSSSGSDAR
jgi:hypothetical protein